jgi:hypothetical protein
MLSVQHKNSSGSAFRFPAVQFSVPSHAASLTLTIHHCEPANNVIIAVLI